MANLVEPQTLKGFRDLLPEAMILRNEAVEKIRRVYAKYGFAPIDTPILEHLSTLIGAGSEETSKSLFQLKSPEEDTVAMRFDLTVPFARIIAQYPLEAKLPFRRYHIGPVFRGDKPDPGRYRQFTQFDIDVAGSKSLVVEAELVSAMVEVMADFGMQPGEFVLQINNLKSIYAFLAQIGITEDAVAKRVMRVVDKLQKIGIESVERELCEGRTDASGAKINGLGLQPSQAAEICRFIKTTAGTRLGVVEQLRGILQPSDLATTALAEMQQLGELLEAVGVDEQTAIFDCSLMRGLDYYTATVFEGYLPAAPMYGSILGGGRYDGLVDRFSETSVAACGVSIGLDRFLDALIHAGKLKVRKSTTKALVIGMKGVNQAHLLGLATELRKAGINTEVYAGAQGASMKDQLSYADDKDIPVAVIVGEDEVKSASVSIKDLARGREIKATVTDRAEYMKLSKAGQVTLPRADMIAHVQKLVG